MTNKPADPLDHVRRPDLPWRAATFTECGRPLADVKSYIERDELIERLRKDGQARTAYTVCMTCWQTARRWKTFAEDPVQAIHREVYGYRVGEEEQLRVELRGLAALADKYREEFDEFVQGMGQTARFERRRNRRAV